MGKGQIYLSIIKHLPLHQQGVSPHRNWVQVYKYFYMLCRLPFFSNKHPNLGSPSGEGFSENWLKNESRGWTNLKIKDLRQSVSDDVTCWWRHMQLQWPSAACPFIPPFIWPSEHRWIKLWPSSCHLICPHQDFLGGQRRSGWISRRDL